MLFLVIVLCLFNIAMWIVLIAKFKKLFSAEDVIKTAKSSLDRIIKDVDNNVYRNVTLINNSISKLQTINTEVEKKIKLLNDLEQKEQNLKQFNVSLVEKAARKAESKQKNHSDADNMQGDLFESTEPVEIDIRSLENALQNSAIFEEKKYTQNTYSVPKNYFPLNPKNKKIDLKKNIISSYNAGKSIEEIASELNCTSTEVQLALSLEGLI